MVYHGFVIHTFDLYDSYAQVASLAYSVHFLQDPSICSKLVTSNLNLHVLVYIKVVACYCKFWYKNTVGY